MGEGEERVKGKKKGKGKKETFLVRDKWLDGKRTWEKIGTASFIREY